VALADDTVATLRRFVTDGGKLLADVLPATYDEHGKPRANGSPLTDLFQGRHAVCLNASADAEAAAELDQALTRLEVTAAIQWRPPRIASPPTRGSTCSGWGRRAIWGSSAIRSPKRPRMARSRYSFNPRAPHDTDCPPYFYNGGFEPRWPLYRVFADYTSRLGLMLTGGRHVCPVALLFLGGSAHVGRHVLPDQISEALQDALYDCDWLPYEVFENDVSLAGKDLRLRAESYRVLIVPPVEVIPYATLAKVKEFFEGGGVVVAYGFLPTKSATLGRDSTDLGSLRDAIWGAVQPGLTVCRTSPAGGRSYLLPEQPTPEQLQQVLADDARVRPALEVVDGETDHWLHVLHRVKAGRDVFFITHQNHLSEPRRFRFRITADGEPECWDPMRNEITTVPHQRTGRQTELTLTMQPNESVLLLFQPDQRPRPRRLEPGSPAAIRTIPLVRDPTPEPTEPALEVGREPLTLSPVKADPFLGHVEVPEDIDLTRSFAYLEMDRLEPETAARVTVNGTYAGGFSGAPLRIEVTSHLQPGHNTIWIEPFAPPAARLVVYAR
jgi:hypothetical protein